MMTALDERRVVVIGGSSGIGLATAKLLASRNGVIETGWWDGMPEDERRATFASFAERAPAGRNGTPEDVADAIAALVGNGFITGIVLPCDGGLRLT